VAQCVSNVPHLNTVFHLISRKLLLRQVVDEDVGLAVEQSVFLLPQSPLELLMSVSIEDTKRSPFYVQKSALETGEGRSRRLFQHNGQR